MTEKKQYEAPMIKVHLVKPADIICTSGNEQYQDGNDPWSGSTPV